MKNIVLALLLLFTISTHAQFKSARLQALGLTCAMCSNAITKALKTIPFVETVEVDLQNTSYNLKFKEGAEVNFDAIRKKVEGAGFTVGMLSVVAEFKDAKVKNDALLMFGGQVFHFVNVKEQVLNGEQQFRIINKYFVPLKEAKKFQSLSKSEILKTEKAGAEGKALGVDAAARVFNVTI
ncbi:MAG: heavy-metal-associated domain-containing protein [Chitinophagaceae bacterium]|nr:heavy-metal-associated domain-containing protein [Chitinophagaceae bacterium]